MQSCPHSPPSVSVTSSTRSVIRPDVAAPCIFCTRSQFKVRFDVFEFLTTQLLYRVETNMQEVRTVVDTCNTALHRPTREVERKVVSEHEQQRVA